MNKKNISLVLTAALVTGSAPTYAAESKIDQFFNQVATAQSGSTFKDTSTHWSKTFVERLAKDGYVKGSNSYFKPDEALKTEDFLIMALKVVKPEYKTLTAAEGESYYKPYLDKALEVGLIKDAAYDEVPQYEGRMMPRELAVQVVDRALTLMGEQVTADHGLEYKFKDYNIINDVNKEAVLKAYQLGIIRGSNGNFEPKNPLTRAEAAVLITKLMDKSMRTPVVVSNNTKVEGYHEVVRWTLDEFQKQVTKKTVVIEKKANGVKNAGDVDFTERAFYLNGKWHNWWTDQQFEDETTGKAENKTEDYANSPSLPNMMEFADLKSVSGGFMPIDGEMLFINIDGELNGKAEKLYNEKLKNFNRVWYDLTKYTTQYAKLSDYYCTSNILSDQVYLSFRQTASDIGEFGYLMIYRNPDYTQKLYDYKYKPFIIFSMRNDFVAQRDKALYEQWLVRMFGEADGKAMFKIAYDWTKGKSSLTNHKPVFKTYKGYSILLSDADGGSPTFEILYK